MEATDHLNTTARPPLIVTPALRRPRRVDLRLVAGTALMLLAAAGAVSTWVVAAPTRDVVVATRDLPAGARLERRDLAVALVRVDDSLYRAAVPAAALPALVGQTLAEPAHAHQLLVPAQVAGPDALAPDQVAYTLPVRPEGALGSQVQPGAFVAVLATTKAASGAALATVALPRARVLQVHRPARASLLGVAGSAPSGAATQPADPPAAVALTLAVSMDEAARLAQARAGGDVDVVVLPPQAPGPSAAPEGQP
jgi:Flp pilus assembly protein CpaB